MTARPIHADAELLGLLVQELERHLAALEARPPSLREAQRAVHALKGSAGLAGEVELAATLERLGRRLQDADESAIAQAATVVRSAIGRLSAGESAVPPPGWPLPPKDLAGISLDPLVRTQYQTEISDRLARIDESLASEGDPVEGVRDVYRHVHSIKGSASAVGDEPMTWFCHGLEDRLQAVGSPEAARAALQEVANWRVVLTGLLDDPDRALARLRAKSRPSHIPRRSTPARGSMRVESEPPRAFDEGATIRVASANVDGLLERFDRVDLVREGIGARAERSRQTAAALRDLRSSLIEALRLIGPPRPWGAPAAALRQIERVTGALGSLGEDLEALGVHLHESEHALRDSVTAAKKQLSGMRQTSIGRIFARLTTAIESEARRNGKAVIVRTRGADETIDRRIAESLVEPCLQLVRNAVAHGIEPPESRQSLGKPASGTIALSARKLGHRLSLTIEDDGAGVDVTTVRARAAEAGLVTPAVAEAADDDTLLSLLFVPGFSTRDSSDLLAGRGIGLDIARSVTQRLGGAIRLSTRAGEGFSARIDLPIESGLVTVLWVMAGGDEFALPAANARRVRKNDGGDAARVPHLLACLDAALGAGSMRAAYAVELDLLGEDPHRESVAIGVDAVRQTEELLVRKLGPLVADLGPFAGAIVRGDGSLRLAIDPWAVAPRARAFVAAQSSGGHPGPTLQ